MRDSTANWGVLDSLQRDSAHQQADQPAAVRWPVVLGFSIALLVMFYLMGHEPSQFAGVQSGDTTEQRIKDHYVDGIEDGNAMRKLLIVAYAAAGAISLAVCRRPWNVQWGSAAGLAALAVWAVASVGWSSDPSLSIRRLSADGLIVVGSLGLARALRPTELLSVALTTFTAFIANSFMFDLAAGGRPWSGDYRFGGTLHPNVQAAYCGMLCVAAVAYPARSAASRWLTRGLLAFGFVMLLLTQSRTSALAAVVAMVMVQAVKLSPRMRWVAAAGLLGFIGAATVVYSSLGDGDRRQIGDTLLLGRTEQSGSLTGRVPLWQELSHHAARRPMTGYGFEAFWTPDRLDEVLDALDWVMQSAHNGYFEVVLQLGWIGLALAACGVGLGANRAPVAYARTTDAGYAFIHGVVSLALVTSLLESHFVKLKYPTVIALVGLLQVVAFFPPISDDEQRANVWPTGHRAARGAAGVADQSSEAEGVRVA